MALTAGRSICGLESRPGIFFKDDVSTRERLVPGQDQATRKRRLIERAIRQQRHHAWTDMVIAGRCLLLAKAVDKVHLLHSLILSQPNSKAAKRSSLSGPIGTTRALRDVSCPRNFRLEPLSSRVLLWRETTFGLVAFHRCRCCSRPTLTKMIKRRKGVGAYVPCRFSPIPLTGRSMMRTRASFWTTRRCESNLDDASHLWSGQVWFSCVATRYWRHC